MKRLILHVGFHKTATSSIQKTLAHNRSELEKQGYVYPIFSRHNHDIINHSIPFYSVYCQQPELYHINIKNGDNHNILEANGDYNRQIDHYLNIESNVIISGEDISVLPHHALESLRDKILDNGFELRVYCSVRKPYPFTCSELQERIKSANGTLSKINVPKKSDFIEKLKQVFGAKVTFSSFEEDIQSEQGAVSAMISRMGLNCESLSIQHSNEGFGNQSTRALAYLNIFYPNIKDGQLNPQGRGMFHQSADDEKFLLTRDEILSIKPALDQENQALNSLLGDQFCDQEYRAIESRTIDLDMAKKLLSAYGKPHTKKRLITYLINQSDFSVDEFISEFQFSPEDLRDIALLLKRTTPNKALIFINHALAARPNGPLIQKTKQDIVSELGKSS